MIIFKNIVFLIPQVQQNYRVKIAVLGNNLLTNQRILAQRGIAKTNETVKLFILPKKKKGKRVVSII